MRRAFVQNGLWRAPRTERVDPRVQRQATLRVSIVAAAATLAIAFVQGGDAPSPTPAPKAVIISAPEIISAKIDARVPEMRTAPSPFRRQSAPAERHEVTVAAQETTATTRVSAPVRDVEAPEPGVIRTGDTTYRLAGITLPDNGRICRRLDGLAVSCVDRALSYQQLLLKGRVVACERAPQMNDGPVEGNCRVGDADIAEQLVRQGWAMAGDKPEERFVLAEAAAKRQKLGIWRE